MSNKKLEQLRKMMSDRWEECRVKFDNNDASTAEGREITTELLADQMDFCIDVQMFIDEELL